MDHVTDSELLARFADKDCEEAFRTLVQRHMNLVYSTALRCTGNPAAAEEITQAVFIILSRKAGSLGKKTVLPGWLYQTARLTAANWQRAESRRIHREQEAYLLSAPGHNPAEANWLELSPLLDGAMGSLGTAERDALVMRYFNNKTFVEVGESLGIAERAAQKRVSRALEKLRGIFTKRGVAMSGMVIAGAISANSVQAAPAALAETITAVAGAKGATAGTSTLALVKGASWLMAWTKAKTPVVTTLAVMLAAGSVTILGTQIAQNISWASPPAAELYPFYLNETYDVQPDGSVVFSSEVKCTNATVQTIKSDVFRGAAVIYKITDESGRTLKFSPVKAAGEVCSISLGKPVRPGGTASYRVEGMIPNFMKTNSAGNLVVKGGEWENNATELTCTNVWILPAGATLLAKDADIQATINGGRTEMKFQRKVPPFRVMSINFEYRLAKRTD
jgi:RNA polymerase sigma factor (sigma-70 family)